MTDDLGQELARFARLTTDVEAAERRGQISIRLIEEVGSARVALTDAGASSFTLAEARAIYERAMRLPVVLE